MPVAGKAAPGAATEWMAWWLAIRPRTLGASLVPVGVGLAIASRSRCLDRGVALATLLAALLLQIAANVANDYYDFARGFDTAGRLGPTRVTQTGLLNATTIKRGLWAVLGSAVLCGAFLVSAGGWPIVLVGAAAAVTAVAYSAGPWPLASFGLGEILAFVFFGPVAVCGTVLLQRSAVDLGSLLASLPIACLVTAIMLVNNLRDIPTDRAAGKRTRAVRVGARRTRLEYAALVSLAFVCALLLALTVTSWALLAFLAVPVAWVEIAAVWKRDGRQLNLSLAGTARLHALFGTLLAIGLLL